MVLTQRYMRLSLQITIIFLVVWNLLPFPKDHDLDIIQYDKTHVWATKIGLLLLYVGMDRI